MANNVSPGVFTKIIDLSSFLVETPGTHAFLPFLSRTGPDNKAVFVASLQQFVDLYGRPNINDFGKSFGQGPYVAYNHISVAPGFWAMRVLPTDATYSNLFVNYNTDSTGAISVTHETTLNTHGEIDTEVAQTTGTITPLVAFYPIGRGDAYDDFAITITKHANTQLTGIYILDIWKTQADGDDVIIETYEISFESTAIDDSGDSIFIVDVVNRYSKWIRVKANETSINEWQKSSIEIVVGDSVTPVHLFNGSEGNIIAVDSDTGKRTMGSTEITNATSLLIDAYTGLIENPESGLLDETVLDLDDTYIPIVYDAGYPTSVKNAAVTLTSSLRLDGVAILDNGDNVSVDAALSARDASHTYNTAYASIFECYSKIFDNHTGKELWVSPVYHMASMIPQNDRLFGIWYPNAGFNRGTVDNIMELRFNPRIADRDRLYLKQVNPIVKFSIGYAVFSNLTTQRKPSALQDLSVHRTILYIQRNLEQFLKFHIFELNTPEEHSRMAAAITPFLSSIKSARGLVDYSVEVGANEYEIKTKQMHVNVILQPTKAIERINLNLFIK